MKTKSLLFSLMFVAGVIGFSSCQKEDADPLTKDQAQEELSITTDEYEAVRGEFENMTGNMAYNALEGLGLEFSLFSDVETSKKVSSPESFTKELRSKFSKQYTQVKSDFDFTGNVGTWTWTIDGWQHSATPTDRIIINFPYNSQTNNATLTYYDYTTKNVTYENQTFTMMSGLKGELKVNNSVVWSFTYSYNFTNEMDFKIYMNMTIGNFVMITEFESNLVNENKWILSESTTVKKDGSTVYKKVYEATYTSTVSQGLNILVNAKVVVKSVEFRIKMEFTMQDLYNENLNPNDIITMSIYTTDGAKIGDFKFELLENEWVLYFYFNNGDKVLASTILEGLNEEVEGFVWDLFSDK